MKLSVHTRTFFLLFFFISLPLSLFPLLFRDRRPLPPSQERALSLFPALFCVTRTRYIDARACSSAPPFTTAMLSRKSNPFSAGPTNGRSRSRCIRQCLHSPFSLFVIRPVQKFRTFLLYTSPLSRTISSAHFRWNTRAQMFSRTRGSALYRVRISLLLSPLAF